MALGGMLGSGVPRRLLGRPEAQELVAFRLPWLMGIILLWAFLIFCRLFWLQGIKREHYRREANRQHLVRLPVPAIRGELRDRKGASLAISLKAESLFCTPHLDFYPNYKSGKQEHEEPTWGEPDRKTAQKVASALSPILGQPVKLIMDKLLKKKRFVFVERQLSMEKVGAIRALKLEATYFLPESRRQYPRQTLACQIIGFTDIDSKGQLGIERNYNEQLAGKDGELVAPKDAKGHLLMLQENFTKVPINGSTLQLTIDSTIQHITENVLAEAFKIAKPLTVYAVVVDPNTGEILAMGGTPTFDPNYPVSKKFRNRSEGDFSAEEKEEYKQELERQKAARKVRPLEDSYEPGSTMKIFTAAIALEERKVRLGEKIDCGPGRWGYSKNLTITDTHKNGVLTFEEVLWKSSNIGTAKIGLRIEPATHYRYLRNFGFGEKSGLNFPGETSGSLISPDQWSGVTQPTFCYGYGLSTTPLQILMAGCALANGGRLMQPYLVQKVYNDQGAVIQENRPRVRCQVLSEETSAMMRETLKGVISNQGTARRAALDGGVVAFGKTGTSRKLVVLPNGKRGYDARKHYSSFMGFFPADKPQYGVLLMLDEPGGGLTGGDVAAPLFKQIGDGILRYQARGKMDEQEPDLKLTLKDWPVSENDEAVIHLESGKVPAVTGLALKSAIHRIVLSGGVPKVEGGDQPEGPYKVLDQFPAAGTPMEAGTVVLLKLRAP